MKTAVSDKAKWQQRLQKQRRNNAERWLALLDNGQNQATLIMADYDNLLRAIESTLRNPDTFDLAFRLITHLHAFVLSYADWERWLIYLQDALEVSDLLQKRDEQARLYELISGIYHQNGNLEKAEAVCQQAIDQYKRIEDDVGHTRAQALMATIYVTTGKTSQSLTTCHQALANAHKIANPKLIADVSLNLSRIHIHLQDWQESWKAASTAHTHYQAANLPQLAGTAIINMVVAWANMGQWEPIRENTTELITLLTDTGDIRRLAWLKNNVGIAAYKQGDYREAESAWQDAHNLISQMNARNEQAHIANNLGMVYIQLKEWEIAEQMLQQAIEVYQLSGDIFNWANALDNLADLHEARGNALACLNTLEEALTGLTKADVSHTTHARQLQKTMQQRHQKLKDTSPSHCQPTH